MIDIVQECADEWLFLIENTGDISREDFAKRLKRLGDMQRKLNPFQWTEYTELIK